MPTDSARQTKKRKPRQEISSCLKWLVCFLNFPAFLFGVAVLALGVYLFIKDYTEINLWEIFLNPATILAFIGFLICSISMMGALGALRDNIFLLKSFAISIFGSYLLIVISTLFVFILFFTDSMGTWSAKNVLLFAVKNYHANRNIAEIVDSVQENFECCGVLSLAQGYRDWSLSHQFNCSVGNPQPEKCGVPYSCCKKSVITQAVGSSNPLLPAMRSLECWQNALNRRPLELEHDIYTRGCLAPLRSAFESNAIHVGTIMALVIIPVCVIVCLTNILAKQIDHQHYLLEREAIRYERRQKRKHLRPRPREMILLESSEKVKTVTKDQIEAVPKTSSSSPLSGVPKNSESSPKKTSKQQQTQAPSRISNPMRSTAPAMPPTSSIPTRKHTPASQINHPLTQSAVNDARFKQWILQQSDLSKISEVPLTPPLS